MLSELDMQAEHGKRLRMFPPRKSPPATFRDYLRSATSGAHARLETAVDFDRRLNSLEAYRSFLEDFLRFLRPLEKELDALDFGKFGIDYPARRKLCRLEADLKDLGHTEESLETIASAPVPLLGDPLAGLGALYVVEGSSLGRRAMLKRLMPLLPIKPIWAGRFFNGYGENTGAMWQSLIAVLNKVGGARNSAEIILASALETFAAFENCLGMSPFPRAPAQKS